MIDDLPSPVRDAPPSPASAIEVREDDGGVGVVGAVIVGGEIECSAAAVSVIARRRRRQDLAAVGRELRIESPAAERSYHRR
jgi:hypothetical protein